MVRGSNRAQLILIGALLVATVIFGLSFLLNSNRAQLILIGALLVATVIFGLSFLLNSLLFTSASGASETGAAITGAEQLTLEVQRSTRSVVLRLNHARRNVTAGDVAGVVESNVTRLGRLLGEAKAASGPVAVLIKYDNATSTRGYRIVQAHDDGFRDGTDLQDNWFPVPGPWTFPNSPPATVGWFTANVDVQDTNVTGSIFTVRARNGSGYQVELELRRDGGNLSVDSTFDPPAGLSTTTSTTCVATGGRALVDLYDGSAFNGDCEFTGIGNLTGPISVQFQNSDRIEGRYAIVLNRSTSHVGTTTYRDCLDGAGNGRPPAQADPCVAPVIWSANVTTSIRTDRVSYRNAFNLSIYPTNQ